MSAKSPSTYLLGLTLALVLQLIGNQDLSSTQSPGIQEVTDTENSEAIENHQTSPLDQLEQMPPPLPDAVIPNYHFGSQNIFLPESETQLEFPFQNGFESHAHSAAASKYVGTNSCVYCHKDGHRNPSHAVAGTEYSIWVNKDPHSCAYNVLFNEQSKKIAKHLKLDVAPHKNDLCLNCHSTNVPKADLAFESKLSLVDGVGCESCHGGAENWLVDHQLPSWKHTSPSQKASLGFVNTDNIADRTRQCVQCHVGSVGRDVNHDLIAAGHPRLYFEMSAYQSKIPRHWSRAKDLHINSPSTETRIWIVGQLVSAAAAIELLNQRVADEKAPWPEFAEYGCFSCHHNLGDELWKTNDNVFANGTGKPDWGGWHFSSIERLALGQLAQNLDLAGSSDLASQLQLLQRSMQRKLPRRERVLELTNGLAQRLNRLADHYSVAHLDETQTAELADRLFNDEADVEELDWDVLVQRYLASVALRQSLMDSQWSNGSFSGFRFESSKQELLQIRDSLKFRDKFNSPRKLTPTERGEIYSQFSSVFNGLKN